MQTEAAVRRRAAFGQAVFVARLNAVVQTGSNTADGGYGMSWFGKTLFAKKTFEKEFARNLYDALVLDGGPSSDAEDHLDAAKLNIRISDFPRFAEKRLITLEAFLFVATQVATTPSNDEELQLLAPVHPLAVQMGKLIQMKWAERGIRIDDLGTVGERCFSEVELALEKPFKWGKKWLNDFYDDESEAGEHYIIWTDQCLKEFQVMQQLVKANT